VIIDLFAGPGGWSTGLNALGRAETVGIDCDRAACDTARAAGHERLQADIAELDPSQAVSSSVVEGLIASPPCQGFSTAGSGKPSRDSRLLVAAVADMACGLDPRVTLAAKLGGTGLVLALEPLRWVLELEPDWTAWEQVPAVMPLWKACAGVLRSRGYQVETGLAQAETFGVPQTRTRAILRARRGALRPIMTTHSRFDQQNPDKLEMGVAKWLSMADALGWGMVRRPAFTVSSGGTRGSHSGHEWGGARTRARMLSLAERNNPEEWLAHPGAPVLRPNDAIRVTPTEAGVLQSFPTDYPWRGSARERYRQIGNAVPPLMAAQVLASVGAGAVSEVAA
jgi:DNA (cytosine-5)-methyltransferase 1